MPSLIIHQKIGYEISKKLLLNSYDYYLGIIAPDAPNVDGFAPKVERWTAHVRDNDLKEWRIKLKKFYLKNKNKYIKDFFIGYYIHILTDIIYDDYFYQKIKNNILASGYLNDNTHQLMSNDMEMYNFSESEKINEILSSKENTYHINNISNEILKKWKNKIIKQPKYQNQSIFINEEIIEKITNKVYEEFVKSDIL